MSRRRVMAGSLVKPPPVPKLLTGSIIYFGDPYPVEYYVREHVFDGNETSEYASAMDWGAWIGLDFGSPKVITAARFIPGLPERAIDTYVELSSTPDFSADVVTLGYMAYSVAGWNDYVITSSEARRYSRYVGGNLCHLKELQFYGLDP